MQNILLLIVQDNLLNCIYFEKGTRCVNETLKNGTLFIWQQLTTQFIYIFTLLTTHACRKFSLMLFHNSYTYICPTASKKYARVYILTIEKNHTLYKTITKIVWSLKVKKYDPETSVLLNVWNRSGVISEKKELYCCRCCGKNLSVFCVWVTATVYMLIYFAIF